jgi:hypothetical protein
LLRGRYDPPRRLARQEDLVQRRREEHRDERARVEEAWVEEPD